MYPFPVWMPGVQNQGIGRAVLSVKPVEEPCLSASSWLVWMPGVQNQGTGRAVLSVKPVEEPCLSASSWGGGWPALASLACGSIIPSSASALTWPSFLLVCCYSVAKLCLTLCDPHGLQHTSLPCPSLSPRVCSDSCQLSQWCRPLLLSLSIILSIRVFSNE